ncbi:MAG: ABC transporter ATP-binding protein [Oscillospiraceae bacterium]|nr:ABC transporter ATP-binding protein [Oscillospiraceae bacterium]
MISTENLKKTFSGFNALESITCNIQDGSIYGMVGSNGAGKSTFLRIITGIYKPDSGNVIIDGQPVWENPEVKKRIAFVPDELYFLAGANINRMEKMYKSLYPTFSEEKCRKLTKLFELDPKKPLNTFSKGMRRQAATLLALSIQPDYIFFDETFDGLDPVMRNLVKKLICEDVLERNATAVITSHSLRELEDICDQLALLHKGGIVLQSDVENLKTEQFKIQAAFRKNYEKEDFEKIGIKVQNFTRQGTVINMIVKSDRETASAKLRSLDPVLLEILPLSLEEVFTYEMDALGYTFNLE